MSVPSEVLWDVFAQLSRDEIEKCQLVSLPWNSTIVRNSKKIPFRKFYRLLYNGLSWRLDPTRLDTPTNSTREWRNFGKFAKNEDEFERRAKALKFCIFEEVNLVVDKVDQWQIVEAVKELSEKSEDKVKTDVLRVSQQLYFIEEYRKGLERYVETQEFAISMEIPELVSLFRHPQTLATLNSTSNEKLRFETNSFPGSESIDAFLRFFDRGGLIGANQYTWVFGKLSDRGFRKILEVFLHSLDPSTMLNKVHFDFLMSNFDKLSRIALADQARELLKKHVICYTTDIEGEDLSQKTTYEIRRRDGYMLKIVFVTSWKNHLNAPISADFTIEKWC